MLQPPALSARTRSAEITRECGEIRCCNHPYLFPGAEPEPFEEGEHIVAASAKLLLLDRLFRKMKPRGDRVLLSS